MGGKKNKKQIKQEKQQRKQEYQLQQQQQQQAQEDNLEENIKESSKVTTAIISTDDEDELFITDEDNSNNNNNNRNSNYHYYTDDDEDDEDEEEEVSRITNYWVEDTPIKEELYDREKFSSNLLSNDSIILEPKVQFNTTKKVFHFTKSPVELSHESYFDADYNGFQDYDGDDEDNGDNNQDDQEDDDEDNYNGQHTDEDEDEDIEVLEVGIKKTTTNSKSNTQKHRDEYYDYDELNDSSSEEIRSSRKKKNQNFYFYSHPPTSSESDTSDKDQLKKSNDDDDDDDEDEEGMNSVEEHSDIEQESLDLSSFNSTPSISTSNSTSITNTPITAATNTTTNVILNQTQTQTQTLPESPTTQLRQWAQRPQVKYVSRFTPPQPISPQTLSSSTESQRNMLSTSIESDDEKSDNDSEYDDETEEEEEEEEQETEGTENEEEESEINISGSDIENEEIKNIIRNRSSMEQTLIDARAKAEAERIKLREYFNQAKVDLRQTIENVSKIFTENDGSNGDLISSSSSSINNSNGIQQKDKQQQQQQQLLPISIINQPIRNELEEVSSTLIQLENKIEEIEESLKNNSSNNKSGSPTSSIGSGKSNNSGSSKSKIKINSLLTEFVHLKQQIEKEKTEKINRDCELKDITEHLLEMASQLSKAIIYKLNVDSSNNNSITNSPLIKHVNQQSQLQQQTQQPLSTTTTTTTTTTLMMEIEFYRKQIEMLEKRLMTWKHHNELLHLELLSDKQSNSEELLNLSYKIKQVEQERDKLREKIDDLMSDIGEKEGRELIFKEKIQNLLNDKGSLSIIIEDMQKDRDYTIDRFNSLIVQIKIMGESTVDTLNDIIDQLTSEREQLQSSIELAEHERSKLIDQLTLVSSQLDDSECNRKSISESHSNLLLSCENTFKALESSELKCTHFQSQLSIVNKKLIWTESEVDRLTKEINRLDKVNFSFYQQQQQIQPEDNNNNNENEDQSDTIISTTIEDQDNNSVNGESFNGIKDKTNSIKSILNNERNEIIQLGSNLSLIIEKGKLNSKKTIQCLKEFILKEMEFTKSGLSNKIQEIENQKQSIISSHHHFNNEKLLLDEMNAQKSKLNEMQLKIFKIENQIINNSNSNQSSLVSSPPILSNQLQQQQQLQQQSNTTIGNDQQSNFESIDDRDQFTQLRKLENKIRKIEAGISEISTQTPPLTPLLSATTITTSTTTTTHTYGNGGNVGNNKAEITSIATDNNSNIPIIIQDEINLTETITTKITTPPSSSSSTTQTTTTTCINKNAESLSTITPSSSEFNENTETPQSPSVIKTTSSSSSTIISKIKLITLNSLLMGAGSSLSIMYFRLLFNNSTGSSNIGNGINSSLSQIDLSNKDHVISLLKFSCKFGLFVSSGYGLFKLLNLSINYKSNTNGESEELTSSTPSSINQTTTTTTTPTKNSNNNNNNNNFGVIGATLLGGILGGILLFKERKSIYLLTGGLIGLTNAFIFSYGGSAIPIGQIDQFRGKPFTFLPIGSLVYDLPLHVNGYFQLSNARDKIEYSSTTDNPNFNEFITKEWNHFISKSIIPYFYQLSLDYMKIKNIDNGNDGLYCYFPFKKNIQTTSDKSSPEIDISNKTMELILNGKYFKHLFKSNTYLSLDESIVVQDDTPEFIIEILRERIIDAISIPLELLGHLKLKYPTKLNFLSKKYLCSILKTSPLSTYSEDVLDYLCDLNTINNGYIHGVNLIPVLHNPNELHYLKNDQIFNEEFIFKYMSDQIFDFISNLCPTTDNILKLSKLPRNFQKNIKSITSRFNNIKEFDLLQFINFLNRFSTKIFSDQESTKIWDFLLELNISNTLSINQISNLSIIKYRDNLSNTIGITSFNSLNLLKYNENLLSIESILNKLNIFMVQKGNASNNFIIQNEISTILTISQGFNFELDPNEINIFRKFLIQETQSLLYTPGFINLCQLFFSLPIHPCIGNVSKFSNISYSTTCVYDYPQIDKYEINGIILVKIDDFSRTSLFKKLPTSAVLVESNIYRDYILPNISKFPIQKSILIIIDFLKYLKHYVMKGDSFILNGNWVPSENGVYNSPKNYSRINLSTEKELLLKIQPNKIIHHQLEPYYSYFEIAGLASTLPISELFFQIPEWISNSNNEIEFKTIFSKYLEYLELKKNQISIEFINRISKIRFIPISKIETYNGFEISNDQNKISLSESSLSIEKDISFTCKYPITGISVNSPLYDYLRNQTNSNIMVHWNNLNNLDFHSYQHIQPKSIFINIYKKINQLIKSSYINEQHLKNIKVIWSNGIFVDINKLYKEGNINLEPYYYKLDPNYFINSFENLFTLLNVKLGLKDQDYLDLILSIQDKNNGINSIPENDINLVIHSIISLKSFCLKEHESVIKLPTNNNKLIEFDKIYYCNYPELPVGFKDTPLLHNSIPESVVIRHKIFKLSQIIQDSVAFENENEFGQKEELVPRLKQILKDYKPEIFFNEMIQNSHDAGATKVHLMFDKNSFKEYLSGDKKDISRCVDFPSYLESSIIVYNNEAFKDKDIKNIQVISGSYKSSDTSCIGQFGLGVNSMYHFTDCPAILTGKWLLIFDPLVSHLEPTTKYSTGAKYLISNYKSYPHLFKPFEHLQKVFRFRFDDGNFNGTITRLPLRKFLIENRFISEAIWNDRFVTDHLKDIESNNVENLMLFTNIKSIKISTLDKNSTDPILIVKVSKKSVQSLESQPFDDILIKIPMQVSEFEFSKQVYNKNSTHANNQFITSTERYIVSKASENQSVANLEKYPNNRVYQFLSIYSGSKRKPAGGIAFKITEGDFTPKSFCWLPLKNLISNIPVHVFGSFSITTAREIVDTHKSMKTMINDPLKTTLPVTEQSKESFLIYWNQLLVQEIIVPIYLNTLALFKYNFITTRSDNSDAINKYYKFYYSLFPKKDISTPFTISDGCFQVLINQFYSTGKRLNLFLPCPSFKIHSENRSTTYFTNLEQIDKLSSVLKCISSLGNNINVVPKDSFEFNFDIDLKSNFWISPSTFTSIIKNKQLNESINTVDDICHLVKYLQNCSCDFLNGCQLLVFTDQTRRSINITDLSIQVQLFNQDHKNLIDGTALNFKFLDEQLSKTILEIGKKHWSETIQIYNFSFVDFYFNVLLPNFNIFDYQKNVEIIELLGYYLKMDTDLFSLDQIQLLKKSKIFPFTDKNGIQQFAPLTELFSPNFKKIGFKLDYPDFDDNKWKSNYQLLGIKEQLDQNDVLKQFKKISTLVYKVTEESEKAELVEKARYLWKSHEIYKIFDDLYELDIVPYRESKIFGGKNKVTGSLCLSKIKDTTTVDCENLYFSNKYILDGIRFPPEYKSVDLDLIFDNFINLLSNVSSWPLINKIINPQIFTLLKDMCDHLNSKDQFSEKQISRLFNTRGIPVENSANSFVSFQNMVLSSTLNVDSYFNVLPTSFSGRYQELFRKLGVKELNANTIRNRLNGEVEFSFGQTSVLNYLYSILNNSGEPLIGVPVMTESRLFKPHNCVFLFDNLTISSKINSGLGLVYEIHDSLKSNYHLYGVEKLSSIVSEQLIGIKEVDQSNDNKFDLFENSEFVKLVNRLNIGQILDTTIKFGIVRTKIILNGMNITGKQESISFYDPNENTLYLDYKSSKKEVINYLCTKVLRNRNHIDELEQFIDSISFKNTNNIENQIGSMVINNINNDQKNIIETNNTDTNSRSNYFKNTSRRNFNSANCLFSSHHFNNACYYYYTSIELSLKYLLELSNNHNYNRNQPISVLRKLLNNHNLPLVSIELDQHVLSHIVETEISKESASELKNIATLFLNHLK